MINSLISKFVHREDIGVLSSLSIQHLDNAFENPKQFSKEISIFCIEIWNTIMTQDLESNYIDYINDISTLICRFASLFKLDSLLDLSDPFLKTMTKFFELSKENGFTSVLEFVDTSLMTKSARIFAGSMISFGFVIKPTSELKYNIHNINEIICKIILGFSNSENQIFIRDSCLWTLRQLIIYSKHCTDFIKIIQEKLEESLIENNVLLPSICLTLIELINHFNIEESFITNLSEIMIKMLKKVERFNLKLFLKLFNLLLEKNETIAQFQIKKIELSKYLEFKELHSEVYQLYSYLPNSQMNQIIPKIFKEKLTASSLLCISKYIKSGKKLNDSQKKDVTLFMFNRIHKKQDLKIVYDSILSFSNQGINFDQVNEELLSMIESSPSISGLNVYKQLSLKDESMIEKLFNLYVDIFEKSNEIELFILQSYKEIPEDFLKGYKSVILSHVKKGLKNYPLESLQAYERIMNFLSTQDQELFITNDFLTLSNHFSNMLQEKISCILYKSFVNVKEIDLKIIKERFLDFLLENIEKSEYNSLCLCFLLKNEKELNQDLVSTILKNLKKSDQNVNEFLSKFSLKKEFLNQSSDCLSKKVIEVKEEKEMNPNKIILKKGSGLQERMIQ